MTSGAQGHTLISMIINLGHSLRLNVVAEGVETEEQAQLRDLNCDEMQGWLFSKALPAQLKRPGLGLRGSWRKLPVRIAEDYLDAPVLLTTFGRVIRGYRKCLAAAARTQILRRDAPRLHSSRDRLSAPLG